MRREFSTKVRVAAFQRAKGRCESCTAPLFPGKFEYDHRLADAFGGEPTLENCEVICKACHDLKTFTSDIPAIAKSNRVRAKHIGAKTRKGRPLPGGKDSPYRIKMDRTVVPR